MRRWVHPTLGAVWLAALGCGRVGYDALVVLRDADGGADSTGPPDGSPPDAPPPGGPDSATPPGPQQTDTAPDDGAVADSRILDTAIADTAVIDTAVPDTAVIDAMVPDTVLARMAWCLPAHPTALFCDDFESGLPMGEQAYSQQANPAGRSTVAQSTVQFHGGGHSLRAFVPAASTSTTPAWAYLYKGFPTVTQGRLHARAFIYVATSFTLNDKGYLVMLEMGGAGGKVSFDFVGAQLMQLYAAAVGSMNVATQPAALLGRWACVELAVDVAPAGGTGYAELFVDGKSVQRTATGIDTLRTSGFDNLGFGIQNAFKAAADAEIFIDDVILDRKPIGCQ